MDRKDITAAGLLGGDAAVAVYVAWKAPCGCPVVVASTQKLADTDAGEPLSAESFSGFVDFAAQMNAKRMVKWAAEHKCEDTFAPAVN